MTESDQMRELLGVIEARMAELAKERALRNLDALEFFDLPVSCGGDNSFDNLITACLHCNSRRGNRPVMKAVLRGAVDAEPTRWTGAAASPFPEV